MLNCFSLAAKRWANDDWLAALPALMPDAGCPSAPPPGPAPAWQICSTFRAFLGPQGEGFSPPPGRTDRSLHPSCPPRPRPMHGQGWNVSHLHWSSKPGPGCRPGIAGVVSQIRKNTIDTIFFVTEGIKAILNKERMRLGRGFAGRGCMDLLKTGDSPAFRGLLLFTLEKLSKFSCLGTSINYATLYNCPVYIFR